MPLGGIRSIAKMYQALRVAEEKFEDTKGVIRCPKSKKNRQHNGQKKKGQEKFEDSKGVIRSRKQMKDRKCNGQKKKGQRAKQRSTKHYTEN